MKKYLNTIIIIILLIALSLIVFNYLDNDLIKIENKVEVFKEKSLSGITEILNPTFKNKGINTNPYEISAEKGIQIKNDIELYKVFGKFTDDEDRLIYINANKGIYSQENQVIELIGNVLIYDNLGSKTTTTKAIMDIENKKINLLDEVVSISNTSIIKSDSSILDDKNKIVIYTGNVKVKIENKWR